MSGGAPAPEFSRPVRLSELPDGGRTFELSAEAGELAALAERFGLVALGRLEARLRVSWLERGRTAAVSGRLRATATQACVVTLEPVTSETDELVDLVFARGPGRDDPVVSVDEAEPLDGDELDLGELAAAEMALGLDPYPRSPGLDPASVGLGPGGGAAPGPEGPFGALAGLKPKG